MIFFKASTIPISLQNKNLPVKPFIYIYIYLVFITRCSWRISFSINIPFIYISICSLSRLRRTFWPNGCNRSYLYLAAQWSVCLILAIHYKSISHSEQSPQLSLLLFYINQSAFRVLKKLPINFCLCHKTPRHPLAPFIAILGLILNKWLFSYLLFIIEIHSYVMLNTSIPFWATKTQCNFSDR